MITDLKTQCLVLKRNQAKGDKSDKTTIWDGLADHLTRLLFNFDG